MPPPCRASQAVGPSSSPPTPSSHSGSLLWVPLLKTQDLGRRWREPSSRASLWKPSPPPAGWRWGGGGFRGTAAGTCPWGPFQVPRGAWGPGAVGGPGAELQARPCGRGAAARPEPRVGAWEPRSRGESPRGCVRDMLTFAKFSYI